MLKRLILLMGILSCACGFAFQDADFDDEDTIGCPYGCATSIDPQVIQVGHELVKALKAIRFLQERVTVSAPDGSLFVYDEGLLTRPSWNIKYEAEYAYECYEDDWDDEPFEEYIFQETCTTKMDTPLLQQICTAFLKRACSANTFC